MPTSNVPINFICLPSEQWAAGKVTRALGVGELAFEVAGSNPPVVYVLKGDGYKPTQGQNTTDYRRLRVSTSVALDNNSDTSIQEVIDRIFSDIGGLPNLDTTDKTNLVNAINEALSRLTAEATTRAAADADLLEGIGAEETERKAADLALQDNIDAEATAREAADADRWTKAEADARYATTAQGDKADSAIQQEGLEEAINAHNTSTTAHTDIRGSIEELDDLKAPKHNPVFSGLVDAKDAITEVSQPRDYKEGNVAAPYANPDQPSTVKDWKDLYQLTMDTSGQYLIALDTELTDGATEILLGNDVENGYPASLMEFDNGYQQLPVTRDDWQFLYDIVMSASGETLLITDDGSAIDTEIRTDRAAGFPDELIEFDAERGGGGGGVDPFAGAYWV